MPTSSARSTPRTVGHRPSSWLRVGSLIRLPTWFSRGPSALLTQAPQDRGQGALGRVPPHDGRIVEPEPGILAPRVATAARLGPRERLFEAQLALQVRGELAVPQSAHRG